jgi:hypothetical protein
MALVCASLMGYAQSGEWVPQNIFEGGSTNIFESNRQSTLLSPSDSNLFNGPGRLSRDSSLTRSLDPNLYGNSNPGGPGGGGGGGPVDAGVPVDGGLSVILVVGAAMGLRKRARRKDSAVK